MNTLKEFAEKRIEEITGGTCAGLAGIFDILSISRTEAHDIYIGVLKALIMSIVGYVGAYLLKQIATWIQKNLK